jgi:hypothetical protein
MKRFQKISKLFYEYIKVNEENKNMKLQKLVLASSLGYRQAKKKFLDKWRNLNYNTKHFL